MTTRTFVLTDIEGSAALWEQHPDAMDTALVRHDAIIEEGVASFGGNVHKTRGEGDSAFCTFTEAAAAIAAASEIQRALRNERPEGLEIKVRVGIHTGEALERAGDFYGSTVNRAARLRGIGHGGQVLVSAATADLAKPSLPEDLHLADLGEHGLRDLSRPEHVYELRGPGLPAGFPPLLSVGAFPNNLPVQVTSFVGRERELAALVDLVASTPLVTLVAVGGAGKTRMALHAAAELLDDFRDGVWFVRLGDLTDPGLVVQTLADTVGAYDRLSEAGMGDRAREAMEERALDILAQQKTLIVLDNCEHLIAECARIADRIVHRCKDVRIIATSREPMGVEGERVFAVPSLSSADGASLEAPAAQLFVDRARLVRPAFEIDARNSAAVGSIIRRLDGLPLAIELAASRVRNLSVDNLAARLDDAFRVLTGGGRAAVERHRTLEAAITWSYDLLQEKEKTLFRRLAIFAGGFTLDAAESVCGFDPLTPDDVIDVLGSLVDQSLVVYDENQDRYRLYFIIGQFATRELARAGEHDELARRHARFYSPIADRAGVEAFAFGVTTTAEAELDNIRAAVGRVLEEEDRAAALALIWGLGWGWTELGLLREAAGWLERALSLPGRAPGLDELCGAQLATAYAQCWEFGRWREMIARVEPEVMALDPARTVSVMGVSLPLRAIAIQALAAGYGWAGELARGRELVGEIDARWDAGALLVSMQLAMMDGDFDRVLDLQPRAKAACEQMRWGVGARWVDGFAAIALVLGGRADEAYDLLAPVFATTPETSWSGVMMKLVMGQIERARGDRAGARAVLGSVLSEARDRGMLEVAANGLIVLGGTLAEDGDIATSAKIRGAFEAESGRVGLVATPLGQYFFESWDEAIGTAADSAEYAEAHAAGRRLSLTQAVDVALAALGND